MMMVLRGQRSKFLPFWCNLGEGVIIGCRARRGHTWRRLRWKRGRKP
ncbi:hypothetical protein ES332_D01G206500v1 [Gossypium tomentosum]|uniref:Uncharacterized protein n=1 Tax=Gossypium tomentosum TaxID=34277 RepID=A0A5D2MC45_GOSTO|nr:hypothetical protein ES332_D01G206500v1 [Gossypium tomentosum]